MFNSETDDSAKKTHKKLPKTVTMMIEKGNLVIAIKTLATDENINMDEAKDRIDAYETELKMQQQQKLNTLANKQGIPNQALSFDREQVEDESELLIKEKVKTTPSEQNFKSLQNGLDSQLNDLGYKKPLLPYWGKRLLVIALIMIGMFFILWNIFG